ncbi:hypothetical protein ACGIF2_16135 [Cellulomonas sp. P22]|uniref:hypothetical protein n=1 Tax=Cellulomonas sp. P22 TaxID=3373189 RepID=UPI0037BD8BDC
MDIPTVWRARDLARDARRPDGGELERVRRGLYAQPVAADPEDHAGQALAREQRVLQRAAAVRAAITTPSWFSHETAALLWGCDVWQPQDAVHLTQLTNPRVRRAEDPWLRRHWTPDLPPTHRAEVADLPVTSLERTLLDCARLLPERRGLVVADSALRLGADPRALTAMLDATPGSRNIRRARRVVELADARAESPGETLTRHALLTDGFAAPVLQHEVMTHLGVFRLDLAWPELRAGVEFDGFVKYTRHAPSGGAAEVLFAEKRRHDALVEAGWTLLRITWQDLSDPTTITPRLRHLLRTRSPSPSPR